MQGTFLGGINTAFYIEQNNQKEGVKVGESVIALGNTSLLS
jgi:hypothetical protein